MDGSVQFGCARISVDFVCMELVSIKYCFVSDGAWVSVAVGAAMHYAGVFRSFGGPSGADSPPASLGPSTIGSSSDEADCLGCTDSVCPPMCWV